MEYKKLNEAFDRRFKLCESEDVVAYTKYTKDHEELAPKKSPAFEVTKKNWKEQIAGSNKATRLNTTAVRGKVKDFFEKHPNADYAYIIIDHDKVSISAKKPTNESYIAEDIFDIFKKKNKSEIFKEASIKEIANGADPIDFSDEAKKELQANTNELEEDFDKPKHPYRRSGRQVKDPRTPTQKRDDAWADYRGNVYYTPMPGGYRYQTGIKGIDSRLGDVNKYYYGNYGDYAFESYDPEDNRAADYDTRPYYSDFDRDEDKFRQELEKRAEQKRRAFAELRRKQNRKFESYDPEDDDYDLMDLMDADLVDDSEEEFDDEYDPEDDLMFNDGIDALEGQRRWKPGLEDARYYYGDDFDPLEDADMYDYYSGYNRVYGESLNESEELNELFAKKKNQKALSHIVDKESEGLADVDAYDTAYGASRGTTMRDVDTRGLRNATAQGMRGKNMLSRARQNIFGYNYQDLKAGRDAARKFADRRRNDIYGDQNVIDEYSKKLDAEYNAEQAAIARRRREDNDEMVAKHKQTRKRERERANRQPVEFTYVDSSLLNDRGTGHNF